jgi:quercetin 2,3-dioxygenase
MNEKLTTYSSRLFKADQRTLVLNENHKQCQVIDPQQPAPVHFNVLHHVNDVFLLPGRHLKHIADPEITEIILPVAGAVVYHDEDVSDEFISAEEALILNHVPGTYVLQNPYEDESINFIQLGLTGCGTLAETVTIAPLLLREHNQLTSLELSTQAGTFYISAGIYQGRAKGTYKLKDQANGFFIYIINGAFEVEERLMEHRDGLALWNNAEIEFEALSEFAILLVLELPLNNE